MLMFTLSVGLTWVAAVFPGGDNGSFSLIGLKAELG